MAEKSRASLATFVTHLLRTIRCRTSTVKRLFRHDTRIDIQQHRQMFYSFIFPYFVWACPVFLYLTRLQQQLLNKSFCYYLKLSYGLSDWPDHLFSLLLMNILYLIVFKSTRSVLKWLY